MQKRLALLTAFFMFFTAARSAAADGGYWYAAADGGRSHYDEGDLTQNSGSQCTFGVPIGCITRTYHGVQSNDRGYRISGGYQFNDYWGLEGGYVDLGEAHASVTITENLSPIPNNIRYDVKARGWGISGTGSYPISSSWSLTGRLGMIRADAEEDDHFELCANGCDFTDKTTNWRWTLGGSLNWAFTEDWMLRLSFDHYRHLGGSNATAQFSVNLTSLGVVYRFR